MENKNWWHPDILAKTEIFFHDDSNELQLDLNNDFGSYKYVLKYKNIKRSQLHLHNDLHPYHKISAIDKLLGPFYPKSIMDAGCGMGYTTKAIHHYYKNCIVKGYDISSDAIEFATKTHLGPNFIQSIISPDMKNLENYDLIYAIEFYPFSRNSDIDFQKQFIEFFTNHLNPKGKLIIWQNWNNQDSIATILDDLIVILPNLKFTLHFIPHHKILNYFPVFISMYINNLLELIIRRKLKKSVLIIEK